MVEKVVSASAGMSTIVVGGDVVKVTFEGHPVNYVFIRHVSGEILVSRLSNVADGVDGTVKLSAGGYRFDVSAPVIYISGSGVCEVSASALGDFPFKVSGKGGEIPDLSVYAKKTDVPNIKVNSAVDADTLNGLHADDFVNATDKGQIQIPNNVDVPAWINANGKRYQKYMTNDVNIGLTNVPNGGIDWVWYWFDGINIIAREWATGKYYICDTINGGFSGWKDIYTSGYKPYVTGNISVSYSTESQRFEILDFTPSAVICKYASRYENDGTIRWATPITNGFAVTVSSTEATSMSYIAFK